MSIGKAKFNQIKLLTVNSLNVIGSSLASENYLNPNNLKSLQIY